MPTINFAEAINTLADDCANISEGHGFWDPESVGNMGIIPLKLVLIVSEAVEALKVHRDEYDDSEEDSLSGLTEMQSEDFVDELADIVIRTFDLASYYDLPLGEAVLNKMEKNKGRPYRHGKRY